MIRASIAYTGVVLGILSSGASHAEYFGLPNAGLVKSLSDSGPTIEAAFSSGSLEDADYTHIGVRAGYQLFDDLMIFADLGNSDVSGFSDISYGLGAVYKLNNALPFVTSTALKTSIHRFEYGSACTTVNFNGTTEIDFDISFEPTLAVGIIPCARDATGISAELLLKGQPLQNLAINEITPGWFASVGIQTFGDSDIDTLLDLGGGLAYTYKKGTLYAAIENITDIVLSIGYQHKFN